MINVEILNSISDDFSSTFSLIDSQTISNLFTEDNRAEVEQIIKKHINNAHVEFLKTGQLSSDPKVLDVWIIRVRPK